MDSLQREAYVICDFTRFVQLYVCMSIPSQICSPAVLRSKLWVVSSIPDDSTFSKAGQEKKFALHSRKRLPLENQFLSVLICDFDLGLCRAEVWDFSSLPTHANPSSRQPNSEILPHYHLQVTSTVLVLRTARKRGFVNSMYNCTGNGNHAFVL